MQPIVCSLLHAPFPCGTSLKVLHHNRWYYPPCNARTPKCQSAAEYCHFQQFMCHIAVKMVCIDSIFLPRYAIHIGLAHL